MVKDFRLLRAVVDVERLVQQDQLQTFAFSPSVSLADDLHCVPPLIPYVVSHVDYSAEDGHEDRIHYLGLVTENKPGFINAIIINSDEFSAVLQTP